MAETQQAMIGRIQWGLRFLMGGLFLYAGMIKARDPSQFLQDIESYRLLPYPLAVALAVYLPWVEVFSGSALLLKKFYGGALVILQGLMMIFVLVLGSAWCRGLNISCGCFGKSEEVANYPWFLFRDAIILAALGFLTFGEWKGIFQLEIGFWGRKLEKTDWQKHLGEENKCESSNWG